MNQGKWGHEGFEEHRAPAHNRGRYRREIPERFKRNSNSPHDQLNQNNNRGGYAGTNRQQSGHDDRFDNPPNRYNNDRYELQGNVSSRYNNNYQGSQRGGRGRGDRYHDKRGASNSFDYNGERDNYDQQQGGLSAKSFPKEDREYDVKRNITENVAPERGSFGNGIKERKSSADEDGSSQQAPSLTQPSGGPEGYHGMPTAPIPIMPPGMHMGPRGFGPPPPGYMMGYPMGPPPHGFGPIPPEAMRGRGGMIRTPRGIMRMPPPDMQHPGARPAMMMSQSPSSYGEPPFKKMDSPKSPDFVPSFLEDKLSPPAAKHAPAVKKSALFDPEWIDKTSIMKTVSVDSGDGRGDEEDTNARRPTVQRYQPPQRRWKQDRSASAGDQDYPEYRDMAGDAGRHPPVGRRGYSQDEEPPRRAPPTRGYSQDGDDHEAPTRRGPPAASRHEDYNRGDAGFRGPRSLSQGSWEEEERFYDNNSRRSAANEWKESMRIDDVSYHRSNSGHHPATGSPGNQWRPRSPPAGNREWRNHRSPPRGSSRQGSSPPPRFRQQQHEMAPAPHRDSPPAQQPGSRYREDSPPSRGGRYHDDQRGAAQPPPRFSASSRERDGVASSAPVRESPPRVVRFSRTDDRGYSTGSQDQEDSSYSSSNHYRERGYQPRSPGSEGAGESPRSQDGGYKGRYFDGGYGRLKRDSESRAAESERSVERDREPSKREPVIVKAAPTTTTAKEPERKPRAEESQSAPATAAPASSSATKLRRPDIEVYIPRGRRGLPEKPTPKISVCEDPFAPEPQPSPPPSAAAKPAAKQDSGSSSNQQATAASSQPKPATTTAGGGSKKKKKKGGKIDPAKVEVPPEPEITWEETETARAAREQREQALSAAAGAAKPTSKQQPAKASPPPAAVISEPASSEPPAPEMRAEERPKKKKSRYVTKAKAAARQAALAAKAGNSGAGAVNVMEDLKDTFSGAGAAKTVAKEDSSEAVVPCSVEEEAKPGEVPVSWDGEASAAGKEEQEAEKEGNMEVSQEEGEEVEQEVAKSGIEELDSVMELISQDDDSGTGTEQGAVDGQSSVATDAEPDEQPTAREQKEQEEHSVEDEEEAMLVSGDELPDDDTATGHDGEKKDEGHTEAATVPVPDSSDVVETNASAKVNGEVSEQTPQDNEEPVASMEQSQPDTAPEEKEPRAMEQQENSSEQTLSESPAETSEEVGTPTPPEEEEGEAAVVEEGELSAEAPVVEEAAPQQPDPASMVATAKPKKRKLKSKKGAAGGGGKSSSNEINYKLVDDLFSTEKAAEKHVGDVETSPGPAAEALVPAGEEEEVVESWDALFDDNGDCLDPKLVDELAVAVGNVTVEKTQFDYYNFRPEEPDMDYSEYAHLIEIFDFPSDMITRDLMMAFKEYQDKGFDIKWVDDTHAIGVFASSIAARSALGLQHPMIKVRPISQASKQTKVKARKSAEFLQPFKPRPETSASVARNLVAGALGLRPQISREKRAEERKKLVEAKEKKKAASKLAKDAWEGKVAPCAMDTV